MYQKQQYSRKKTLYKSFFFLNRDATSFFFGKPFIRSEVYLPLPIIAEELLFSRLLFCKLHTSDEAEGSCSSGCSVHCCEGSCSSGCSVHCCEGSCSSGCSVHCCEGSCSSGCSVHCCEGKVPVSEQVQLVIWCFTPSQPLRLSQGVNV